MKSRLICMVALSSIAVLGQEPGLVDLSAGGRLVARYQSAPAPMKPYVKELFTPSGVQVLLDSPSDHVHHHGLMFALAAGGVDFWSEKPAEKFGSQAPRAGETKAASGSISQALDWKSPAGAVVVTESRSIQLSAPVTDGPNVLTWTSAMNAPTGGVPVVLSGAHYFGLGLRLLPDLNGKAVFIHSDRATGTVYRGEESLTPGRWCAVQGEVGGKPVTVAMFDHPQNPRQPAVWFTMAKPFAYLSATLDVEKHPQPLVAGAPLVCRYGVALWDGQVGAGEIEKACARWRASGG